MAPVIIDYFCNHTPIVECFRSLTESRKKAWLQRWVENAIQEVPHSRISISIIDGNRLISNYSVPRHLNTKQPRRWAADLLGVSSQRVSFGEVAATECAKLWDSRPWITVEHPGRPGDHRALPEKLIASLFYVKLVTLPELGSAPSSVLLEVKCRLQPGLHTNSIARELLEQKSQLKCSVWGTRTTTTLCDPSVWQLIKAGGELSRRIEIKVLSLDTEILLQIDNENLSNCPCRLRDLISQEPIVHDRDEIPSQLSLGQVESREGSDIVEPTLVKIAFDGGVPDTKDSKARSTGLTDDGWTEKIGFDEELGKIEEAIQQISLIYRDISKGPYSEVV